MLKPRILIVEDEADIREILSLELLFANCDVIECDSVASADRRLGKQHFDLVVADMCLGDGSGLLLLRRLREDLKLQTPFCLMTGDFKIRESQVIAAGGQLLIPKPFYLPDVVPQMFSVMAPFT